MTHRAPVVLPQHPQDCRRLGFDQMRHLLQDLRMNPVRRPDIVYQCGKLLLANHAKQLGDEIWIILEQVLVAALDLNRPADAEECWKKLASRFSEDSRRVQRLRGLILEAQEKYQEADECYEAILEQTNNCDKQAHKRRVAIAKARGHRGDAVSKLEEYIAIFQVDEEAFHELADLHLVECDYWKACHCLEEIILGDPQNYLFMHKYAEGLYSIGEKMTTLEARRYFAQSIRLNDTIANLRAYYGLWITCLALSGQFGMRDNADNSAVMAWVTAKLRTLYRKHSGDTVQGRICLMLDAAGGQ